MKTSIFQLFTHPSIEGVCVPLESLQEGCQLLPLEEPLETNTSFHKIFR